MMIKNLFYLIPFTLYLASCSAPGVKAKDANLFQAMANNSSGESDNQLKVARMKAAESRKELSLELSKNKGLSLKLESTQLEKQQLDQQVSMLQQENTTLEQNIRNKKSLNKAQETKKQQRLAKIQRVNSSIAKLKKVKHKLPTKQYNKRVIALQNEIKILRRVSENQ